MIGLLAFAIATVADQNAARCAPMGLEHVSRSIHPDPARPQLLGELPPATAFLAVRRTVDGCSKPVVVRYDIGQPRR